MIARNETEIREMIEAWDYLIKFAESAPRLATYAPGPFIFGQKVLRWILGEANLPSPNIEALKNDLRFAERNA